MHKILLYIALLFSSLVSAQADSVWSYTVGWGDFEDLSKITKDSSGNLWSVGTTWSASGMGSQILVVHTDSLLNCRKSFDMGDEGVQSGEDIWITPDQSVWILSSSSGPTTNGYDPSIFQLSPTGNLVQEKVLLTDGWQDAESFHWHQEQFAVGGYSWNNQLLNQAEVWIWNTTSDELNHVSLPIVGYDMHAPLMAWDTTNQAWMALFNYWTVQDSLPNTAVFWLDHSGTIVQSIVNDPLCKGIQMWDAVPHNGNWTAAGGYLENGVFRGHLMYWNTNGVISNAAAFPATPTESILRSIELKGEGDGYVVAGWTFYFGAGFADAYIHGLDFNMTWLGGGAIGGVGVDKVKDVFAFSRNTLMMVGENASQDASNQKQGWILKFNDDYITTSDLPIVLGQVDCLDLNIAEEMVQSDLTIFFDGHAWNFSQPVMEMKLYNVQGQIVEQERGLFYNWNPSNHAQGVYVLSLKDALGIEKTMKILID